MELSLSAVVNAPEIQRVVDRSIACIPDCQLGPSPATVSPAPTAGQIADEVTAAPSVTGEMLGASAAPTAAPVATPVHGTPGICTFVDTISGTEKEQGQDRLSVQVNELVPRRRTLRGTRNYGLHSVEHPDGFLRGYSAWAERDQSVLSTSRLTRCGYRERCPDLYQNNEWSYGKRFALVVPPTERLRSPTSYSLAETDETCCAVADQERRAGGEGEYAELRANAHDLWKR